MSARAGARKSPAIPLVVEWRRQFAAWLAEEGPAMPGAWIAVAWALASFADADGSNARPGHDRLARMAGGVSLDTVERAVSWWIGAGWLERVQRGNRWGAAVYRLVLHPAPVPGVEGADETATSRTGAGLKVLHPARRASTSRMGADPPSDLEGKSSGLRPDDDFPRDDVATATPDGADAPPPPEWAVADRPPARRTTIPTLAEQRVREQQRREAEEAERTRQLAALAEFVDVDTTGAPA